MMIWNVLVTVIIIKLSSCDDAHCYSYPLAIFLVNKQFPGPPAEYCNNKYFCATILRVANQAHKRQQWKQPTVMGPPNTNDRPTLTCGEQCHYKVDSWLTCVRRH